jgi:hypothetical protein
MRRVQSVCRDKYAIYARLFGRCVYEYDTAWRNLSYLIRERKFNEIADSNASSLQMKALELSEALGSN